jgi:tetratricopeptide (TPR) repeat protein
MPARLVAVFITLAIPAGALPAAAQADPAALARSDELWKKRDDPAALGEMKKILDSALAKAPSDYEVLWRGAVYYSWISDDPDRAPEDKARLGKIGWDLGERAVAANPARVEGHFSAAVTMGNYSLGIGILRALTQRIEGKFTGRLREAERIDPNFNNSAIPVIWGRYYASLPWPKYDEKKATAEFQRALKMNPNNLRARVYWADLLLEEGHPQEAKKLVDEVLRAPVGRYDAPEERRAQKIAARMAPKIQEKLK